MTPHLQGPRALPVLPLLVPDPWGPAGHSSGVPDWGLSPLRSLFPFLLFSEAISVLQEPPLPCLGPQLGTVGHSLGQGRGHGVWGARVAQGQQGPIPAARVCPRVPPGAGHCHPALRTVGWTGQAGISSAGVFCSPLDPVLPQIRPCPAPNVVEAQRTGIITAHRERRIMEWFGWEGTSQPPRHGSKTSSPRYSLPHPPAALPAASLSPFPCLAQPSLTRKAQKGAIAWKLQPDLW